MEKKDNTYIDNGDDTGGRAIRETLQQDLDPDPDYVVNSGPDKFTFVHFYKYPNICTAFVQYIQGLQYEVGHICCNGEGCRIVNADDKTAENLKQLFVQKLHEAGYHYKEYHYEDSSS
jgi:hypothetical protein